MENNTLEFYNSNYNEYYNSTVSLDLSKIYLEFTERLPKEAAVLDLGCGSGRDSLYFKKQGYSVTAVDGSEKLALLASKLLGQEVIVSRFEDLELKGKFEGIWACASLLHLNDIELDRLLVKCEDALADNGVLYMSFKYGEKEFIDEKGRYFNGYTEEKIENLIDRISGLELSKVYKTIDVIPGREDVVWLNVLCTKRGK